MSLCLGAPLRNSTLLLAARDQSACCGEWQPRFLVLPCRWRVAGSWRENSLPIVYLCFVFQVAFTSSLDPSRFLVSSVVRWTKTLFSCVLRMLQNRVYVSAGLVLSPVWTFDNCDLDTVSTRAGNRREVKA